MALAPGKGAHLVLNEEILEFLMEALRIVNHDYTDALHDSEPGVVIDNLVAEEGWSEEKDNFGRKAFTHMKYKEGELRVTVVHTKRDELKLDLREWFQPS